MSQYQIVVMISIVIFVVMLRVTVIGHYRDGDDVAAAADDGDDC